MKRVGVCVAVLTWLASAPLAAADDEFDALMAEFEQAQGKWFEQLSRADEEPKADEGAQAEKKAAGQPPASESELVDPDNMPPHPAKKFLPRFRAYAEQQAGKPEAIPALSWMVAATELVSGPGAGVDQPDPAVWALRRLTKDHAKDAEVKDVFGDLRYVLMPDRGPLVDLYERVIKENPADDAKAGATFNLASLYWEGSAISLDEPDERRNADKKRGEALFRSLVKDYPDTKAAKSAESYLFEIDHLQVGMKAPEIVGKDVDGTELRLSKFLGKVVVLYFWGFW